MRSKVLSEEDKQFYLGMVSVICICSHNDGILVNSADKFTFLFTILKFKQNVFTLHVYDLTSVSGGGTAGHKSFSICVLKIFFEKRRFNNCTLTECFLYLNLTNGQSVDVT